MASSVLDRQSIFKKIIFPALLFLSIVFFCLVVEKTNGKWRWDWWDSRSSWLHLFSWFFLFFPQPKYSTQTDEIEITHTPDPSSLCLYLKYIFFCTFTESIDSVSKKTHRLGVLDWAFVVGSSSTGGGGAMSTSLRSRVMMSSHTHTQIAGCLRFIYSGTDGV